MAQKIKRSPDEIVELQVEGQNVLNLQINQNTDVDISSPVSGQVLSYNGTQWTNQEATGKVLSVNGYTGTVVLTKSDIGLGNVDNTSDANKPISTATQAALDTKYSSSNPPPYPVTSVNSLTGAVTIAVPTKTSDLTNDSGFITSAQAPVQSVNTKTGAVVLTQDDVGSGTTYVQTENNFTDADVTKLSGIASGAQVNVIESVQQNGNALPITSKTVNVTVPTKTSDITNDSGYITSSQAPVQSVNGYTGVVTLTKSDIGLGNVANVLQYSTSNPPPYPVTSVNGYTGTVTLSKTDVGLGNVANVLQYSASNPPPYPVTSVNGLTGAVSLTTDTVPATATNRYVPAVPTTNPSVTFLNGNGVFTTIAVGGATSVANVFLSNTASTVSGYKTLSYDADATSTEMSVTCTSAADVLSATYLYAAPLGVTSIDAGIWKSTFYMKCSANAGTNRLKFTCFVRHADNTETDLFTNYTPSVAQTSYGYFYTETNRTTFTVLATDRLGFRIYGNTSRTSSTTIYYQIGGTDASYFNTPLALRHSQLRDLNGDTSYQHITTAQVAQIATNTTNITTLQSTKLDKTGDGSNVTATFTEATTSDNITSGSTLSILFGAIQKAISNLISHISNVSNPHSVTKAQVGLGNVANVLQYSASNPPPYPVTSVNGSTGDVTITDIIGNAATSTQFASAQSVALTGDVTGSVSSQAGWSVPATLAASGVTAGSYGLSANATPAFGGTFNVPYVTVDAKGRTTSATFHTVTVPSALVSTTVNGLMSSTDKTKLDGIEAGAQVNTVTSVNGSTGAVVLTASDVGALSSSTTYVASINGSTGAVTLDLGGLNGVTLSTPANGQILSYNGTAWVNSDPASYTQQQANWSETSTSSVQYIQNKPTALSAFTNDTNFITAAGAPVQSVNGQTGTVSITTITGNAGTASALTTNAGTATRPVYFSGGIPVAGTYTLGSACAKAFTDSSSASAISKGTSLTTERDVYYGLPTINGSHAYTSGTNIYPPTTVGTNGYLLQSSGGNTPSWVAQSTITAGKATADGSGNTITTTYAPLASPALTGTPTAPTAVTGTSTTQIATTAFVQSAVSSISSGNVTYLSSTQPTSANSGDIWYQIL